MYQHSYCSTDVKGTTEIFSVDGMTWGLGNSHCLERHKIALLSSTLYPGSAILPSLDKAKELRDTGKCVISGFHSELEKACLIVLLRGTQSIIVCPARSLHNMRIPPMLRPAFEEGRILFLSPFEVKHKRVTVSLAHQRNHFVASIADEIIFLHVHPGGKMEAVKRMVESGELGDKKRAITIFE